MNRHYGKVAQRAEHRCEYCCAPEVVFNLPFEVEHIVPASERGPDDESNLALACRSCNLFKSSQQSPDRAATPSRDSGPVGRARIDRYQGSQPHPCENLR